MWRLEDNLQELLLSFYHVVPGDRTQEVGFGSKHFHPRHVIGRKSQYRFKRSIRDLVRWLSCYEHLWILQWTQVYCTWWLTIILNSSSEDLMPSSDLCGRQALMHVVHKRTFRQNTHKKI